MEDCTETVMRVFRSFGAHRIPDKKPTVRLTKLAHVEGRKPKIPIGFVVEGELQYMPDIGESFNIDNPKGTNYKMWCTSIVEEYFENNTFRTKNSVYKWEEIK